MGTAHIYGDPPTAVCGESASLGYGLAPTVGRAWEEAFHASALEGQRKVILRTSFVVGRNRGAGGVCRLGAESGVAARVHARIAPVCWGAGWTSGDGVDGSHRCSAADGHRS